MRKKIEKLVLSWDTFIAIIAAIIAYVLIPEPITNKFCGSIYGMAINVLAIVFSIFFASLAVIMAFPDNEFIKFIESDDDRLFSKLLMYFRDTLFALFISLISTIVIYIVTIYLSETDEANRYLFVVFIFLFTYSLMATIIAVDVALKITGSRATFLINSSKKEPEEEQEEQEEQEQKS